jgi:hypothetical protein
MVTSETTTEERIARVVFSSNSVTDQKHIFYKITAGESEIYVIEQYTLKYHDVDDEDEVITVKADRREEYELGRKVEFVYKLGTSVDEDDYKKLSKYDDDIEGLLAFLEDCEDAGDSCMVALTLDDDYVVRVKATAE